MKLIKPIARGKSIFFREVSNDDADFIVSLRTDPTKNQFISATSNDVDEQKRFIGQYLKSETDFYFVICNWESRAIGTIRLYDVQEGSFCWGSWILISEAPSSAALESALLMYDFAFYALHYKRSHFDVRKENKRVVEFHKRLGAVVVSEDELNLYFTFEHDAYISIREKYKRFLP